MKSTKEMKLEDLMTEVAKASGTELTETQISFLRFLDRDRDLAKANKERREKVNSILANKETLNQIIIKTAKTDRKLDDIVNSIAYDSDVLDIMFNLSSQASESESLKSKSILLLKENRELKKENSRLWLKVANLKRKVKKAASMTYKKFAFEDYNKIVDLEAKLETANEKVDVYDNRIKMLYKMYEKALKKQESASISTLGKLGIESIDSEWGQTPSLPGQADVFRGIEK